MSVEKISTSDFGRQFEFGRHGFLNFPITVYRGVTKII
jgi:hypothetical protein